MRRVNVNVQRTIVLIEYRRLDRSIEQEKLLWLIICPTIRFVTEIAVIGKDSFHQYKTFCHFSSHFHSKKLDITIS